MIFVYDFTGKINIMSVKDLSVLVNWSIVQYIRNRLEVLLNKNLAENCGGGLDFLT